VSDLKSMKLSKADREAQFPKAIEMERPLYPYGLSITLEEQVIDKLGLESLPKVGTTLILVARVEVTSVSAHQAVGDEKRRSVGLQMTDLCLEDDDGALVDGADLLYGKAT